MRKAILYILIFSDGENVLIPNNTNRLFIYTSHLITFEVAQYFCALYKNQKKVHEYKAIYSIYVGFNSCLYLWASGPPLYLTTCPSCSSL